jgi:hypothetical protein
LQRLDENIRKSVIYIVLARNFAELHVAIVRK